MNYKIEHTTHADGGEVNVKITFRQALGTEFTHDFTDSDGFHHHLEAFCDTDDESIMDCPATWSCMDSARSDGEIRTHGQREELEMGTHLDAIIDQIKAKFPGIELHFDYADQSFEQTTAEGIAPRKIESWTRDQAKEHGQC